MTRPWENSLPLMNQTFSCSSERLPKIAEVKSQIYTDHTWMEAGEYNPEKHSTTRRVRESYVGQSFVLLTEEFLLSLKLLCLDFTNIVEVGSGIGWLGHWLGKYGVTIQASIDNKSWPEYPKDRYLNIVEDMDSLLYVTLHPEVDLFILVWPEEDDLARCIWQALQPGQSLLYIGEGRNGCTATNSFLDLIKGHEIETIATIQMKESFLSFDDFHDHPHLYEKGKGSIDHADKRDVIQSKLLG
jgi:hypothetical protein